MRSVTGTKPVQVHCASSAGDSKVRLSTMDSTRIFRPSNNW